MPTQVEILQEQMLLIGMGLKPVKIWPPRCQWYNSDGSVNGTLPCDPYSRLLYLGRGLIPEVAMPEETHDNVTLLDAVVDLMSDRPMHEGTASEILNVLEGMVVGLSPVLPLDATRFSIALFELASPSELLDAAPCRYLADVQVAEGVYSGAMWGHEPSRHLA